MKEKIKILYAASEVVPFSKTGGLADVVGALSKTVSQDSRFDVRVVTPYYNQIVPQEYEYKSFLKNIIVHLGNKKINCDILTTKLPDINITYYLVKKDKYYDREELYGTSEGGYEDNAKRFIFFSYIILTMIKNMDWKPDIIHCNDWQTGLVPTYLKTLYRYDPDYFGIKTVYTIHNLAYQGLFWHWDMHMTNLGWEVFTPDKLEFHGKINLMKAGIVFSDRITTVSKTYAKEIQQPKYGYGLDGVIRELSDKLIGINNGIDYGEWDPATDPYLYGLNYSADNPDNKKNIKTKLQAELGLFEKSDIPILAMIGRFTEQKGYKLLIEILDELMAMKIQIIILGTGDEDYDEKFELVKSKYSEKFAYVNEFNNELAHKIEAGSDIFLMPSKFEPCGLNQLISFKYATIPIVHSTGGLKDTVVTYSKPNMKKNSANGFTFNKYVPKEFLRIIKKALQIYNNPDEWNALIKNAQDEDWSWQKSASEYIKLYKNVLKD